MARDDGGPADEDRPPAPGLRRRARARLRADGRPLSGTGALAALRSADGDLRAWARLAPLGLLLVGAGACVTGDAATRRAAGDATARWVLAGTAGLLLQGAGLSVFGESVKRRALHDVRTQRAGAVGPGGREEQA